MRQLILAVVLLTPLFIIARAHEWYDPWCCNERDCRRAHPGEVTWTPNGYRIKGFNQLLPLTGSHIRRIPTQHDRGYYHLCIMNGKVHCLYLSVGGI